MFLADFRMVFRASYSPFYTRGRWIPPQRRYHTSCLGDVAGALVPSSLRLPKVLSFCFVPFSFFGCKKPPKNKHEDLTTLPLSGARRPQWWVVSPACWSTSSCALCSPTRCAKGSWWWPSCALDKGEVGKWGGWGVFVCYGFFYVDCSCWCVCLMIFPM